MIVAINRALLTIAKHRIALAKAGRKLGVPWNRIFKHDNSKFHPIEFMQYVRKFELGIDEPQQWAKAWQHHWQHNDHHIEYWEDKALTFTLSPKVSEGDILNEGGIGGGTKQDQGKPIWMPNNAVREMIADWIAGSLAYSSQYPKAGTWQWGNKHLVGMLMRLETHAQQELCTRCFAIKLLVENEMITDEQISVLNTSGC